MKLESLKYFVSLSENLSFTRTAEEYHIAQTAVSKYIAALEQELGIKLFERNSRNVSLTTAGKCFYHDIVPVLSLYYSAMGNIQALRAGESGTLFIGIGQFEECFLPPLLQRFHDNYPNIQVNVSQYTYGELWQRMVNGEFDVIFPHPFFKYVLDDKIFEKHDLFTFAYCVLVSRNHHLAEKDVIEAEDFTQETVVTLSEESGPTVYSRFYINSDRVNVHPKRLIPANTTMALFSMVEANYGIGFAPHFTLPIIPDGILLKQQRPYPKDRYFALTRYGNTNPALEYFLNIMNRSGDLWKSNECK